MKIRNDSWHYKVFVWSHLMPLDYWQFDGYKTSLCPYFWRVMLALLWLPPVTLICLLGKVFWIPVDLIDHGSSLFSWNQFHPFVSVRHDRNPLIEGISGIFYSCLIFLVGVKLMTHWMEVCLMICLVVSMISALIFSISGLILFWDKVLWDKIQSKSKSENSLVLAYLSAVKQKVCPKIEFVNKD